LLWQRRVERLSPGRGEKVKTRALGLVHLGPGGKHRDGPLLVIVACEAEMRHGGARKQKKISQHPARSPGEVRGGKKTKQQKTSSSNGKT